MKKVFSTLKNACVIAVLLELVICVFALFGSSAKLYLNPRSILFLLVFSVLISFSVLIFGIKNIPYLVKVLLNYLTVTIGFVCFLLLTRNTSLTGSKIVISLFLFTVLYAVCFAIVFAVKRQKPDKRKK